MKINKRIALITVCALVFIGGVCGVIFVILPYASSVKTHQTDATNQQLVADIVSNQPKSFFITGWGNPDAYAGFAPFFYVPLSQSEIADQFNAIPEAGLNSIIETDDTDWTAHSSDSLDSLFTEGINTAKITAIVTEPTYDVKYHQTPKGKSAYSFGASSAVIGVLGYDEPGVLSFGTLASDQKKFKADFPDKLYYINLLPNGDDSQGYASGGNSHQVITYTGKPISYADYIADFMTTVHPEVLSFDHYPFLTNTIDPTFLSNVELMAQTAKQANIPLWSFVQDEGYSGHRTPGLGDIKWDVFTNLAYGASGIEYFAYNTQGGRGTTFTPAMIDKGKKTSVYTEVQQINQELRSFQSAFLSYKWQNTAVYQPTTDENPQIAAMIAQLKNPQTTAPGIRSYTAQHAILIGNFANSKGQKAYMVTNFSESELHESNQVMLQFDHATQATVYLDGKKQVFTLQNGRLSLNLGVGEGAFVVPE